MKIAILGDSHDDYVNLVKAVDLANEYGCELMLHAGDLGAPGKCVDVLESFNGEVKMILGNNDHEIVGLMRKTFSGNNFELVKSSNGGDCYEEEVDGVRIFMHHYPRMAELAAASGEFDLCVFGHTHRYHVDKVGETLLINPSSIKESKEPASFVVYDTSNRTHKKIVL